MQWIIFEDEQGNRWASNSEARELLPAPTPRQSDREWVLRTHFGAKVLSGKVHNPAAFGPRRLYQSLTDGS